MTPLKRHILLGGLLGFGLLVIAVFLAIHILVGQRISVAQWILYAVLWTIASLVFGWLRWILRGRAREAGEETGCQRWSRPVLAGILSVIVLSLPLLFAFGFGGVGHGDGYRVIRVTGRLVSGNTLEPLPDARVLAVSSYDLEHPWDPESAWAELEAIGAERAELPPPGEEDDASRWAYVCDNAGTRSRADGSIDLQVGLWCWFTRVGLLKTEGVQEAADAVAALWIAPAGRDGVLVRIERARWHDARDRRPRSIWGTYDLGTVVVPEGEGR